MNRNTWREDAISACELSNRILLLLIAIRSDRGRSNDSRRNRKRITIIILDHRDVTRASRERHRRESRLVEFVEIRPRDTASAFIIAVIRGASGE